ALPHRYRVRQEVDVRRAGRLGPVTMAVTLKLWLEQGIFCTCSLGSPGIGEGKVAQAGRPGGTGGGGARMGEPRASASRPDRGIARIRQVTVNQRGEHVLEQETVVFLKRRPVRLTNSSARA